MLRISLCESISRSICSIEMTSLRDFGQNYAAVPTSAFLPVVVPTFADESLACMNSKR